MKKLQFAFASLLLLAVFTTGSAFTSNVETSKTSKVFSPDFYDWSAANFTIGVSSSTLLSNPNNWNGPLTSGALCNGGNKMCGAVVTYSGSPAPIEQDIINAIKAEYDRLVTAGTLGTVFVHNYSWIVTINGVSVTIQVFFKP